MIIQADGTYPTDIPALGATNSQINMLLFHMTSQIFVNVKTTTGADKVTLKDRPRHEAEQLTKVEILNFLPDGKVLMGTGAVSTTDGTRTEMHLLQQWNMGRINLALHQNKSTAHSYGIVPQALSWGTSSCKAPSAYALQRLMAISTS